MPNSTSDEEVDFGTFEVTQATIDAVAVSGPLGPGPQSAEVAYRDGTLSISTRISEGGATDAPRPLAPREVTQLVGVLRAQLVHPGKGIDVLALQTFLSLLLRSDPSSSTLFDHARFADITRDEDAALVGHVGIGRDTVGTIRDQAGLRGPNAMVGDFSYEQHDAPGPPGEFRPLTPGERASLTAALSAFVAAADPPVDPLWREMLGDLTAVSEPLAPEAPEPGLAFEPNLYDLEGDGVRVFYQTTTFVGPGEFTFEGPDGKVTRHGSEIEVMQTALGTEVTILLRAVPDLEVVTLTLALPAVVLDGDPQAFTTFAVETTGALNIGGPAQLGPGPLATYRLFELSGTAQFVTP